MWWAGFIKNDNGTSNTSATSPGCGCHVAADDTYATTGVTTYAVAVV